MAYKYKKYEESDAVKQAKANLETQLAQKPGAYQSQWQTQLDDTLKKIQNRQPFTYNINGDALYQSYKDKFVRQGQQAMQDTMGQAAGLTGGYSSSYGQNVGQQAYNAYLQNLGDVVPELYEIARNRYNQEGADLMNMYGLLGDNEAKDYGRWQDAMSAWKGERDYLAGLYDSERSYDYGKWSDDRDFGYAKYRDEVADKQWERQFAEQQRQYNASLAARYAAQQEAQKKAVTTGGSGDKEVDKAQAEHGGSYYADALSDLKKMKSSGAPNGDASKYLQAMLNNKLLTSSEYSRLYNKYRNNEL